MYIHTKNKENKTNKNKTLIKSPKQGSMALDYPMFIPTCCSLTLFFLLRFRNRKHLFMRSFKIDLYVHIFSYVLKQKAV